MHRGKSTLTANLTACGSSCSSILNSFLLLSPLWRVSCTWINFKNVFFKHNPTYPKSQVSPWALREMTSESLLTEGTGSDLTSSASVPMTLSRRIKHLRMDQLKLNISRFSIRVHYNQLLLDWSAPIMDGDITFIQNGMEAKTIWIQQQLILINSNLTAAVVFCLEQDSNSGLGVWARTYFYMMLGHLTPPRFHWQGNEEFDGPHPNSTLLSTPA